MKLSDYLIYYLEQIGVRDVFLLSGGGMMHLLETESKRCIIPPPESKNTSLTPICSR